MTSSRSVGVALRPWSEGDLGLLERLMGDPAMTDHLGGPETPEKIRHRNERYAAIGDPGTGAMFVITVGTGADPAGSIGYWNREWGGEMIWETGWSVLPEFQGRGVATAATALVVASARNDGANRFIHAFPSVDNEASNAVCRKVGFTLLGACEFEYPMGHFSPSNDWVLDLQGALDR